jgi:hypothetical protein
MKTTRTIALQLGHTEVGGRMLIPSYGRAIIRIKVKPKAVKFISDDMFKGLPM